MRGSELFMVAVAGLTFVGLMFLISPKTFHLVKDTLMTPQPGAAQSNGGARYDWKAEMEDRNLMMQRQQEKWQRNFNGGNRIGR